MQKLGLHSLKRTGEQKLSVEVKDTIGGVGVDSTASTLGVETSSDYRPPDNKPISSGKRNRQKRKEMHPRDAVSILRSALAICQKSGIGIALVNLPQRHIPSSGVVLAGVILCKKCNIPTWGNDGVLCEECDGR